MTMESAAFTPVGFLTLALFVLAYVGVVCEEFIAMKKSKPVLLGAGLIWLSIAVFAPSFGVSHDDLHHAIHGGLEEFGSLLLFLLAAMTYVDSLRDRNVLAVLQTKMVRLGLSYRKLFWVTGVLAFCLSPIIDNLTTALVVGTIIVTVGAGNPRFIAISCISAVNAANAGGAFSPFGDITTLMVWQAGHVAFTEFFALFLPSLVCFIIPAAIMSPFIGQGNPPPITESVAMKRGGKRIIALGILTIAMAVAFENFLGLPPFVGMMVGLSFLMILGWYINSRGKNPDKDFDVIDIVSSAEWDTLLFFYGVMFCIGGLGFVGWLSFASHALYGGMGADATNILLGQVSALIDNIPIMFAVLTMNPDMSHFQWLLVTLTTGIGGSLLAAGSAAGVALMGVARGHYTFASHLKWTPVLALGFAAAVGMHYWVNG
jgi:Na+/H+ antiporter NhaD/arsenite permease-like protein